MNWTIEDAYRFNESLTNTGNSFKIGIHGAENSAATGDPTVKSAPIDGRTLTADTTAIMDADGLHNVSYSYQWVRVDEDGMSNATPISGETGSTYTLTAADVGKRVIVIRVSFTDDNLIPEERTSEAFPADGTVIDELRVTDVEVTFDADRRLLRRHQRDHLQGDLQRQRDGDRHPAVRLRHRRQYPSGELHRRLSLHRADLLLHGDRI